MGTLTFPVKLATSSLSKFDEEFHDVGISWQLFLSVANIIARVNICQKVEERSFKSIKDAAITVHYTICGSTDV